MKLTDVLFSQNYYNAIPADDLIAKQRYKLFRTTSFVGFLTCLLVTIQTITLFNISNAILYMITISGIIFIANLYLLPVHKNHHLAYTTMVLLSLLFLHVQTYYSGGIRASGFFYLSSLIMLGFMLLGNRKGWIVAILSGLQIGYFYFISTFYPSMINYAIVGDTKEMIDMDYLFTSLFSVLIITAQINYLESGKNIVIERITQSRNELREKNKELRKLSIVASKADNAIGIINSEGIMEWVNDGFVRLTGYQAIEVTGKDAFQYFAGRNSDPQVIASIKSAMRMKQNYVSEILKNHKNGTPYWTQVTLTPILNEENSETKYIFIESNITTRKIAEEKMKQYLANLEKSNAELDKFAYVVSHDLKAPLRAIGNLTGWIEEDIGDKLPADSVGHFNTIKNRVVRMEGLINGILDYTKANKNGGKIEAFKCDELIRETIDLLGVPENAIINIRNGMPAMNTEKVKLQQVFMNIINNAIRYNDKEDIQVDISVEDKINEWQFNISDNGPGIEPKYHDKIFVIFQTLNARDEVESRGVGLAIVKKLIEDEGGKIWVESDAGLGSKFCFTWPKTKRRLPEELLTEEAVTV